MANAPPKEVHILWISEGLSCDGDTVSLTGASQPSIEDVVLGLIPGIPKVILHNKVLAYETGEDYLKPFRAAAAGTLGAPFVLVIEGSIPNENINGDGYWTSFGNDLKTGEPITLNTWIDRLAPKAWGVVACGTCATYGGIHAMAGNPTGAWVCATTSDGTSSPRRGCRSSTYLAVRSSRTTSWRRWCGYSSTPRAKRRSFRSTSSTGRRGSLARRCTRAAIVLATTSKPTSRTITTHLNVQVKVGCWGPVVNCNVPKRGWIGGVGGCPNVGGICIGCTMPGFPDRFMPFMDEPPGGLLSSSIITGYGKFIRAMRGITNRTINKEPKWRHNGPDLTSGYRSLSAHAEQDEWRLHENTRIATSSRWRGTR